MFKVKEAKLLRAELLPLLRMPAGSARTAVTGIRSVTGNHSGQLQALDPCGDQNCVDRAGPCQKGSALARLAPSDSTMGEGFEATSTPPGMFSWG